MARQTRPKEEYTSFLYTCETLYRIYRRHREAIPNNNMRKAWPHGNPFTDGTDLSEVSIAMHAPGSTVIKYEQLDTDYSPISWNSMPALVRIGLNNLDAGVCYPFLLSWEDFGEDDTLTIHCCDDEARKTIFDPSKDSALWALLDGWKSDEFYIGTIYNDDIRLTSVENFDALRNAVSKTLNIAHTPMIVQRVEGDCAGSIVIWFYSCDYSSYNDEL